MNEPSKQTAAAVYQRFPLEESFVMLVDYQEMTLGWEWKAKAHLAALF